MEMLHVVDLFKEAAAKKVKLDELLATHYEPVYAKELPQEKEHRLHLEERMQRVEAELRSRAVALGDLKEMLLNLVVAERVEEKLERKELEELEEKHEMKRSTYGPFMADTSDQREAGARREAALKKPLNLYSQLALPAASDSAEPKFSLDSASREISRLVELPPRTILNGCCAVERPGVAEGAPPTR